MLVPRDDEWPPRRALPRRGADLARRRRRVLLVALYGGVLVVALLLGGWATVRWPDAIPESIVAAQLLVLAVGVSAVEIWRASSARPPRCPPTVPTVPPGRARWSGPLLLAAATLYLVGLGALRDRVADVPNLVWVGVLAVLLVAGGTRSAGARTLHADEADRHRRMAHRALLLGAAALVVGALSVHESSERWTDDARAAGALALCVALALLPFGLALRRRLGPVLRARDAQRAEQRAWLAAAYPAPPALAPHAHAASPLDGRQPRDPDARPVRRWERRP